MEREPLNRLTEKKWPDTGQKKEKAQRVRQSYSNKNYSYQSF
jgi:hypothetical protein